MSSGVRPQARRDRRFCREACTRRPVDLRHVLLVALVFAAASLLGGCCGDSVEFAAIDLRGQGVIAYVHVGDTATLRGRTYANRPPDLPSCDLYDSSKYPERFSFHSSDSLIATIDDRGFLTALEEGETVLTTVADGVPSNALVLVVEARTDSSVARTRLDPVTDGRQALAAPTPGAPLRCRSPVFSLVRISSIAFADFLPPTP
jgi:hypothetical protein